MNNLIRIMAMSEDAMHKTIFSSVRNEAGINTIYDPEAGKELYQVFIHNLLPYSEMKSWLFATFSEARSFAAKTFAQNWEIHAWDFTLRRKCGTAEDGISCGSGGGCDSCSSNAEGGGGCGPKSSSGGCSSCAIENDA